MGSAEKGEGIVIEGLYAQTDAIDTGAGKGRKSGGLDGSGVGLKRNFNVVAERKALCGGLDNGGCRFRRHQRGGAAAEKDAVDAPRAGDLGIMFELA